LVIGKSISQRFYIFFLQRLMYCFFCFFFRITQILIIYDFRKYLECESNMVNVQHLFVLFVWTFHRQVANGNQLKCDYHFTLANFKLNTLATKTFSSLSSEECLKQCSLNLTECQSINYLTQENKCEFNQGTHLTNPEALLPSTGYVYMYNESAQSPGLRKCSKKLCSTDKYCYINGTDEDYTCVECPEGKGPGLEF